MKLFIQFNSKLKNNNQVIRVLDIIIVNNLEEHEISGIMSYRYYSRYLFLLPKNKINVRYNMNLLSKNLKHK